MSVCGTINDLVVMGAIPLYITCSFIIEEGFDMGDLEAIVKSMDSTARKDDIKIVAGDTKVVERGYCDGIYITTTGLGIVPDGINYSPVAMQIDDQVILTAPPGAHGLSVFAARNHLEVEPPPQSDCASLLSLLEPLNSLEVRCMRDPTRGGLTAVLNELAIKGRKGIKIDETSIPVNPTVTSLMELLGLEPYQLANEGAAVIIISKKDAQRALEILREHPLGRKASIIGEITAHNPGQVIMATLLGTERINQMPTGMIIPRIC